MYPKTLCGWTNKIVYGYVYNEKTASLLDCALGPSPRLLSMLDRAYPTRKIRKNGKAKLSDVRALLKQYPKKASRGDLARCVDRVDASARADTGGQRWME